MRTLRKGDQIEEALGMLLMGYKEELNLYSVVRRLTLGQRKILNNGRDMLRFNDMHDEKQDVLRLIDQIDKELSKAKKVVTSKHSPHAGPERKLAHVLDRVTETIEGIRSVERENIELLNLQPVAV